MKEHVIPGLRHPQLPPIDPTRVPIEADLSRADVCVLHQLCAGKTVIEYGAGGSTLLLARFARVVLSYEQTLAWFEAVARVARRRRRRVPMAKLVLRHVPDCMPPADLPRVNVMFVDGQRDKRHHWVEAAIRRRLADVIVLHDSRARKSPIAACSALLTWPHTLMIDRVSYHYRNSNHLVVWLRKKPVAYENWNRTETGRLPHLHVD